MKTVRELSIALLCLAVSGAVGAGAWMLITAKPSESKADKPASPAKVDKVVKEEDLGNVSISEEAYGRLGVRVAPAAKRNVARKPLPHLTDVRVPRCLRQFPVQSAHSAWRALPADPRRWARPA